MKSTKYSVNQPLKVNNRLNNLIIGLLIFMMLSVMQLSAQITIDFNHFAQLYNDGNYQQLYDEAVALRKDPYGKTWKIDYFISKALCASGYEEQAKKAFNYTLSAYKGNLDKKQFDFLMKERDACLTTINSSAIPPSIITNLISVNSNDYASVSGKMGYIVNCNSDAGAFEVDTSFSSEGLEERLFEIGDTAKAVAYYKELLGSDYKVRAGGRYLFIIPRSGNFANLSEVTRKLESAYNFYSQNFNLRKPDKIIAVYLMGNETNLRTVAKKVHGINLPNRNIGYSCLADLSLLGTSSVNTIGTIYHELFHLMVRTDVGDIPGWLDEGVACLYETSTWENTKLRGNVKQWRTEIFRGLMFPRLESLIENNWDEFSIAPGINACEVALNYALAKHFAIYLQENGLVRDVITAFKERKNVMVDLSYANESDFLVLERALGRPFTEIQADFDNWMNITYSVNPVRNDGYATQLLDRTYFAGDHEYFETKKSSLNEELLKVSGTGYLPDWYIANLNSFILEAKHSFNH